MNGPSRAPDLAELLTETLRYRGIPILDKRCPEYFCTARDGTHRMDRQSTPVSQRDTDHLSLETVDICPTATPHGLEAAQTEFPPVTAVASPYVLVFLVDNPG